MWKEKQGKETGQQGKDLGKICPEGDGKAGWEASLPAGVAT